MTIDFWVGIGTSVYDRCEIVDGISLRLRFSNGVLECCVGYVTLWGMRRYVTHDGGFESQDEFPRQIY